jgi:hypothetical protein
VARKEKKSQKIFICLIDVFPLIYFNTFDYLSNYKKNFVNNKNYQKNTQNIFYLFRLDSLIKKYYIYLAMLKTILNVLV